MSRCECGCLTYRRILLLLLTLELYRIAGGYVNKWNEHSKRPDVNWSNKIYLYIFVWNCKCVERYVYTYMFVYMSSILVILRCLNAPFISPFYTLTTNTQPTVYTLVLPTSSSITQRVIHATCVPTYLPLYLSRYTFSCQSKRSMYTF